MSFIGEGNRLLLNKAEFNLSLEVVFYRERDDGFCYLRGGIFGGDKSSSSSTSSSSGGSSSNRRKNTTTTNNDSSSNSSCSDDEEEDFLQKDKCQRVDIIKLDIIDPDACKRAINFMYKVLNRFDYSKMGGNRK